MDLLQNTKAVNLFHRNGKKTGEFDLPEELSQTPTRFNPRRISRRRTFNARHASANYAKARRVKRYDYGIGYGR